MVCAYLPIPAANLCTASRIAWASLITTEAPVYTAVAPTKEAQLLAEAKRHDSGLTAKQLRIVTAGTVPTDPVRKRKR